MSFISIQNDNECISFFNGAFNVPLSFVFRKLLHSLCCLIGAMSVVLFDMHFLIWVVIVLLSAGCVIEWILLQHSIETIPVAVRTVLHYFENKDEALDPDAHGTLHAQGAFIMLLAYMLSLMFFQAYIVAGIFLIIGLADPAAAVIGKILPLIPLGKKSLGGSVTFFLIALGVCLLLHISLLYAVGIALITALVELTAPIDDNLFVPLSAGLMIHGALFFGAVLNVAPSG